MTKPAQFQNWPETLQPGFGPYRAVVERVVDGDTLYVFVDLGINHYAYISLRLDGFDAPEIFSGDADERKRGLLARAQLERVAPPGTKASMYTYKDAMSFGRYRASLFLGPESDIASDDNPTGYVNAHMREWIANREVAGWSA